MAAGEKTIRHVYVLSPGTQVEIGTHGDPIAADLLEVCIGDELRVKYKVAWWSGRTRHTEWISPAEVRTVSEQPLAIGFR